MDLSSVIAAVDAVVLERIRGARFVRRSAPPSWWDVCCKEYDVNDEIAITDVFPFLEVFLPEADRVWAAGDGPIVSEMWTESGGNHDTHLMAIATCVGDAEVLAIIRNDVGFYERQLLLQRARELRMTHSALMREIERKDVLLHTIVHDLTAPLHSIIGSLSLLREMELPDGGLRWAELAMQAATRQRALIQDILDVFVTEQGPAESREHGRVDLPRAIERAVSEREPVARQRQIELVVTPVMPLRVVANETRLLRVVTNLLDNAIRHSPIHTRVCVSTQAEETSVVIAVDDEGPGVSLEVMPRLFQKLARDPRGTGNGLGLYFCRITVEQWGGGIGYEERPEGGARFWIRLAIAAADDQPTTTRTYAHG